jgi:hypothetical protein
MVKKLENLLLIHTSCIKHGNRHMIIKNKEYEGKTLIKKPYRSIKKMIYETS